MLIADIYDCLNHLFGPPIKVERGRYTRHEDIFVTDTLKTLREIEPMLRPDSSVLVVGCGSGVELGWFAERCARGGIHVDRHSVDQSAERCRDIANVECQLVDGYRLPYPNTSFNLIFMHNVCEHTIHIQLCFAEYYRILMPGGMLVNVFAPLFYSPFGAHLQDALKLPWGHLIFGLQAVVDVRNRYYPGISKARTWPNSAHCVTERRYRQIVRKVGFVDNSYEIKISKNAP